MTTYLQLQTDVAALIIDVPASVQAMIPTFVKDAVRKLQTKHNFKVMETTQTYLTTAGDPVLGALPANFKEWRGDPYHANSDGSITYLGVAAMAPRGYAVYGTGVGGEAEDSVLQGFPRTIWASEPTDELGTQDLVLAPIPDGLSLYSNTDAGEYRIVLPYWKFLTVLSAGGDQNWFTNNAEEYIRYEAASVGFFADHDEERGTLWKQRAQAEFNDVLTRDKKLRLSGMDVLVPSPDVYGDKLGTVQALQTHRGGL